MRDNTKRLGKREDDDGMKCDPRKLAGYIYRIATTKKEEEEKKDSYSKKKTAPLQGAFVEYAGHEESSSSVCNWP